MIKNKKIIDQKEFRIRTNLNVTIEKADCLSGCVQFKNNIIGSGIGNIMEYMAV
jgi:hypothetical protein